ncbi:MAG: hypothetical protein M3401_02380 [Actinomycetota bacterium]|nr:hypothetical protein [Actinomycetota bacterium]
MADVALWDLVAPYFLLGNAAGNVHAALAVLAVDEYEEADDVSSSVLRGRARVYGDVELWFDPTSSSFGVRASNTEGHPRDDPSRRSPWIDLRDTTIDFQLLAPRVGSAIVAAGHAPIDSPPPAAFAPTDAVLDALDAAPVDVPFSDYPSTAFVLDLVVTSGVLRPPFLRPASMRSDGALEPDPDRTEVQLTLPRVKLQISQGSNVGAQPQIALLSFGASGLDDPGDIGVAQMVSMDPPYAFIGPGRTVGFGFRSAVLDLSTGTTPPAVLEQFGFDQSWTGVYFPEIRLFVAPQGAEGWAVNAGVRNLLLGIGASAGVTGDFELDVINQGGEVRIGARFYAPGGRGIAIRRIDGESARVVLPEQSTIVVDIEGGRPPNVTQISLDGGTNFETERVKQLQMTTPTRTIVVKGTASGAPTPQLTIMAQRSDSSGASGSTTTTIPGSIPAAEVTATAATRNGVAVTTPRLVIASQTDSSVTVALDDNSVATWTVDETAIPGPPSRTATFPLAPNTHASVKASVAGATSTAPIYFHFDEPDQMTDAQLEAYALNAEMTRTAESSDEAIVAGWTGGVAILASSEHRDALRSIPPATNVVVVGHASWEGDDNKAAYNRLLSDRRAKVATRLYKELAGAGSSLVFSRVDPARGFSDAKPAQIADPVNNPRRRWWRVELQSPVTVASAATTGTVRRPPVPSTTVITPAPVDPPPAAPERPDFLRSIGAKVRIIRDDFIAVELHGEVNFETATERRLRGQVAESDMPSFTGLGHQNPSDGIVRFRGVFTRNPGSDEWALDVLFGADPSDVDGLVATGSLPGQPLQERSFGRNLLGLYALFFPLLAAASPEKPGTAELEDLVLAGAALAVPAALAATGWFVVERVVWYGGEALLRQHAGEWSTSILADIETAVSADIKIGPLRLLTIARDKPLVARYKAIGVRFGADSNGEAIFHPVFDSSKGYTLDVSRPGALQVADPLGRVLRVDGARISRTNPTMFEVMLGSAVDLGVVSLERCGVRITLADPPTVELTALGVGVDVPGVIAGSGYLAISEHGFAGRLDLTLVPLRLRIAAALRVENIPEAAGGPATGVAVAIEVEFPVAIPLWSSGLGLYGLIGLFAMHFSRNEEPDSASTTKALAWLKRAGGDPTHVEDATLWKPDVDHWAFGVGALVGTMGSPVVFNMKGVFMLELPGPRLLLMMKANVLAPMPEQKGDVEGTLLAVVDLDAGRETLTIGMVIDFEIDPILELKIPIEAFFNGKQPEDWHLYLGKYPDQIRAKIFEVFSGSGYLMLAGDGQLVKNDLPTNVPTPGGFAIATGLHVSMVWGSKSVGLYAELAAGFDAVLGFSPLLVAGEIYARGELRLFVISISASATLNVRLGQPPGQPEQSGYRISGEVCGSIDLFFFEIEGCVDFTIEDNQPPDVVIPTLVEGVTVVSRSPALVHGSASDDPVDAGLGEAHASGAQPADDKMPAVPINAIPVVMFAAPPYDTGVLFKGEDLGGSSGGRVVERSTDKITYTLTKVELLGPISAGPTPATWWTLRPPTESNESAQLALLSWIPNATPKALQASEALTETVKDRWGTVCDQAAPPTPVLWTFRFEPLGPSVPGWLVDGEAWPDPPDTVRSAATPTVLDVGERWRCGDPMVDPFRGVLPAEVVGAIVACPRGGGRDVPNRPVSLPPFLSAGRAVRGGKRPEVIEEPQISFTEMTRRLQQGIAISRAALSQAVIDPEVARGAVGTATAAAAIAGRRCASRILAAPRFDTLAPPQGDPVRENDVDRRWAMLGFEPGDLADGVVLEPGTFDTARVLLFVNRRLLKEQIVVRAVTSDEHVVSEVVVDGSHVVSWVTLPTTWVDPDGPWDDDIAIVMNHLLVLEKGAYVAVLVEVKGDLDAEEVVVGLSPDAEGRMADNLSGPGFYVAALEALLASEIARFDEDSHMVAKNHKVLEAALGPDSGNVALLTPDTAYEVRLTWSASATSPDRDPLNVVDHVQSFWFRTVDDAPDRLDPWVLACIPYEGERQVFGGEPLQISFATHDLTALFAAHGYRLEVRLSAASALHPDPDDLAIPYPLVLDAFNQLPVAGALFSPWEETVAAIVDPDCVEIDETRVRHTVTTIPIPLHPATDYLLDIWRVPEDGTGGTAARVFRRMFATSEFESLAAYAQFCLGSRVTHRAVPAGLAAKVGAAFATREPEGEELDNVLRGNVVPAHEGIEPMPVPDKPRIVVWWEGGGAPQPTAVVIDAREPLWRTRERATLKTLPGTDITHWQLRRDSWVEPIEAADSDSAVARIVRAPGGQRAIAILKPGSRGKHVKLSLRRVAFTESYLDGPGATDQHAPVVDVSLLRAPWEES